MTTSRKLMAASVAVLSGVAGAVLAGPAHVQAASEPVSIPGVEVLTSRSTAKPVSESLRKALSDAQAAAEKSGDVLAPPFVDGSGQLVVPAVGSRGVAAARRGFAPGAVRATVRPVARSTNTLRTLQHEIIGLGTEALPGSGGVYATYIDAPSNRVIVEAGSVGKGLLEGLKTRYGSNAVAVLYVKGAQAPAPQVRNRDTSPFWGGANISMNSRSTGAFRGTCTAGMSWQGPFTSTFMLTAGHCIGDEHRNVSTPATNMGFAFDGVDENWNSVTGTVATPGKGGNHGDVALIRLDPDRRVAPQIYTGAAGATSSSKPVQGMWGARNAVGDSYCTSGAMTGEVCGWKVNAINADVRYTSGAIVRNVTTSTKMGQCTIPGDSGAPAYVYGAGFFTLFAYGINSGGNGASDGFRTPGESPCTQIITDIRTIQDGFGGTVMTSS